MKRLLGQISLTCLYLVAALLGARLLLWGFVDALPPALWLGYDVVVFLLLLLGVLGAAIGDLAQHRSNRYVWLGLALGFPVIFFVEQDYEAWQTARLWENGGYAAARAQAEADFQDIVLRRRGDGHYYIDASFNDQSVEFLVDTGATGVALALSDALRLGVRADRLVYNVQVSTASGTDFGAAVVLPYLDIRGHRFERVPALVMRGGDTSLLGMSIIGEFSTVEIRNDRLVLRR